ncbi:50S ribosomal protein bL37 [Nonomuraea sp. NPDC049714]
MEDGKPHPESGRDEPMARRARKGKARRKKKANHGKRPTAR